MDNFRHEKLDRINQRIIRVKKLLQDIDETQCQCLEELSQRKEFISWVQEALRGTVHHYGGQKAGEFLGGSWGGLPELLGSHSLDHVLHVLHSNFLN